ncbi:MAG: ABC transporter permease [Verrucomicrobia bacterium]|nr:ABC transporter permease [Verrucomicrobiota bacterium]
MNCLPVAQRELRVAARQTRTYGVRWLAAAVALVIVGYTRLYLEGWGVGGGSGRGLFFTLVGLAGWVCALGGARLTADAISREKREGTLGLLFLSHLSGLEVVLGKLVAQAGLAFYGLLATLPVLAIPFLAGGVEAGELWQALAGLANALFFSVSLGLLVSSMTREPRTALGLATLGALGFWLAVPAVASVLTARGTGGGITSVVLACLTPAAMPGFSAGLGFAAPNPWLALAGSSIGLGVPSGGCAFHPGQLAGATGGGGPGPLAADVAGPGPRAFGSASRAACGGAGAECLSVVAGPPPLETPVAGAVRGSGCRRHGGSGGCTWAGSTPRVGYGRVFCRVVCCCTWSSSSGSRAKRWRAWWRIAARGRWNCW